MKKIFCQLILLSVLILMSGNEVLSLETSDGGYEADKIYLENIRNLEAEPESAERVIQQRTELELLDNSLPENRMDDDDEDVLPQTKTDLSDLSDERPLFKKLMEKKIIRTDIPSYLMDDVLTFSIPKGPVSKVQLYGAYNGNIASYWANSNYDTAYDINFLQIGAMGKFRNSKNEFKFLVNPRGVNGRNYMQNFVADAYIANNSIPHHQILIGYSRNQIGKEGGSSSYILPFIMRSQLARNFGSTRALGVRAVGSYDLVDYSVAFNSSDRFFRKWFAGPEFTGWVDLKPLGKTNGKYGKLVIGGGLNTGKNGTNYTVGSFYLGYKYKKLWSRFEYGIADGYNGVQIVDKKAQGFYGVVGYKITPKLQIIGRYDQFDPDRNVSGNTRREYTAGINYFIKGQALRLILNYVFCQNSNAPDSHRIMLGTQVLL